MKPNGPPLSTQHARAVFGLVIITAAIALACGSMIYKSQVSKIENLKTSLIRDILIGSTILEREIEKYNDIAAVVIQLAKIGPSIDVATDDIVENSDQAVLESGGSNKNESVDLRSQSSSNEQSGELENPQELLNDALATIIELKDIDDVWIFSKEGVVLQKNSQDERSKTGSNQTNAADSALFLEIKKRISRNSSVFLFPSDTANSERGNNSAVYYSSPIFDGGGVVSGYLAFKLSKNRLFEALSANLQLNDGDLLFLFGNGENAIFNSTLPDDLQGTDIEVMLATIDWSTLKEGKPETSVIALEYGNVDIIAQSPKVAGNEVVIGLVTTRSRSQPIPDGTLVWNLATLTALAAIFLLINYLNRSFHQKRVLRITESVNRISNGPTQERLDISAFAGIPDNVAFAFDGLRNRLDECNNLKTHFDAQIQERDDAIAALLSGLEKAGRGNLKANLETEQPKGFEELRLALNETLRTFGLLIDSFEHRVGEFHIRIGGVRESAEDLSQRTENQAATLEQTAAALDQLSASVKIAADSASEVESEVRSAQGDAARSGEVVSEAISAMSNIQSSSDEISQIIGVIDDISFQTNLLALNAGVEAARAGEAGRGFAVVASEVRALAQRSSDAAKQIKSLISQSHEQVNTGVTLVGRTGEALDQIIDRVGNISTLMTSIATGAREQATALAEINVGISQLDKVTQQNAAMVQETNSATSELDVQAQTLMDSIGDFKSGGTKPEEQAQTELPRIPKLEVQKELEPKIAFRPASDVKMVDPDPVALFEREAVLETETDAQAWKDF